MAEFQRSVLRDGHWVTETVSVQSVAQSINAPPVKKQRSIKPPTVGLLTKTAVESQIAYQILPVRLRSLHHADVAFIGDHHVQIRELQHDGKLRDIIRRDNFGCRIRKAAVVGNLPADLKTAAHNDPLGPRVKSEDDDDVVMEDVEDGISDGTSQTLQNAPSPQLLLLLLENGQMIFLYLRTQADGTLEFGHFRNKTPKYSIDHDARSDSPGLNEVDVCGQDVVVDPSSRFLAVSCWENYFFVYQLNATQRIHEKPQQGVLRSVQGVIVKMEFLYPRFGDDTHVILLIIIAHNGRSRMVTYEWTLGDDLTSVFSPEKRGTLMPVEHQLPILLIPLKVSTAFILVSEKSMTVCTGFLHGPPEWEEFSLGDQPVTANYHGRSQPLWAAWARPYRLHQFAKAGKDNIYLAREDGVVYFVELETDSTISTSLYMERFDCNISTAFACLWDETADILVIGGDSGPGGVWKIPPRDRCILMEIIPNWSPVVDFVTTDDFTTWNQEVGVAGTQMVRWQDKAPSKPDRIFSTSGRGTQGTVTEYRYGLQAVISYDIECDTGIKQSWLLPRRSRDSTGGYRLDTTGYHLLLSMPNQTTVVHLDRNLEEDDYADQWDYDHTSQTLAAAVSGHDNMLVTVSEKFIVLKGDGFESTIHLSQLECTSNTSVMDAAICDSYIALSAYTNVAQFMIHVLRIDDAVNSSIKLVQSFFVGNAEVNCLSLSRFKEQTVELLAGLWQDSRPLLARARLGGDRRDDLIKVDPYSFSLLPVNQPDGSPNGWEPINSIASCVHGDGQVIVAGFRHGDVVVISLDQSDTPRWIQRERLGLSPAKVYAASEFGTKPMVLATVDRELLLMTGLDAPHKPKTGVLCDKHRVWPVDACEMGGKTPDVDSIMVLPQKFLSHRNDTLSLMILSGQRILIAEMELQPGPVPRHMPVDGTPTNIHYSPHLECLIVGVSRENKPALRFLDPDTGEDLGTPMDKKDGSPRECISGLGKIGDEIKGLSDWEYKQGNNVWRWLLVSVSSSETPRVGKLIVVRTEKDKSQANTNKIAGIKYWTQFKKKDIEYPLLAAIGYQDFVIFSTGNTIVWNILDPQEKRLIQIDAYQVDSPAVSLLMSNGKLLALTHRNGLDVLEPPQVSGTKMTSPCKFLHSDARYSMGRHMIEVGANDASEAGTKSIMLVSDRDHRGVWGLWIPWQVPNKDIEVIFSAELPASIRAFRRGRTRPFWDQQHHRPRYGRIAMTTDDAAILGVCMDGTLQQFSLLDTDAWRLLRYIQNLAGASKEIHPYSYRNAVDPEPNMDDDLEFNSMHVDGDVLQRIFDKRALERLIVSQTQLSRFKELLQELDEGEHAIGIDVEGPDGNAQFFELAYTVLGDFLAPAL